MEIAAAELGVPDDDPSRPLTVTGGMTFAGGPGNNYGTHSLAAMVGVLRERARDHRTDHRARVVRVQAQHRDLRHRSTGRPAPDDDRLPEGTVVETAAGFAWADPQAAVGSLPQCTPDADATGEVTVETYSVSFGRDGSPERAVVACRTPEGRRAWARVTDADHLPSL